MSILQNPLKRTFRADIQGLRAIAIMAVLAFHYNAELLPGGFIGVDVFLVISGYLITSILISRKEVGCNLSEILRDFYISRFKRIVPAYYALLVVVSVAAAILFIPDDFSYYRDSLEKSLYFYSNNYFAGFGDYFAPATSELPLLHTWALALEMQFYLIMPLVVLFIPAKWLRWLIPLGIVGLTLTAEYMIRVEGENQSTYFALYARVPEFLIGGWLALQKIGNQWSERRESFTAFTGLVLILLSAIFITPDAPFPGILALLPCIGASLVICAGKGWPSKLLSWPVLVWLGAISYSLYLWHWPVLAFLRYYAGSYQLDLTLSAFFVVATLVLSCCTYYFVEEVFRNRRTAARVLVPMAVVLVVTVAPLSLVSSAINKNLLEPLPVEFRRYADQKKICHGKINGTCLRGIDRDDTSILVLGDSHAAMLNYFFDAVGEELGITARVITASSCVTIPGFDYQRIPKWAQDPCKQQIAIVENYLESASIIFVAASWSGHTQNENFMSALTEFLEVRASKNQKILLLAQIPRFKKNPLRAQRFDSLNIPTSLPRDESYLTANLEIKQLADKYQYVQYIDLTRLPIFDAAPLYEGVLIYHDEHHLNEIGSKIYGKHASSYLRDLGLLDSEKGIF
ncbi:MAG: acyltransferase [Proteobacteria bacterium]|nr:acyltransferase [Pseudomonadota bacterium]MBU1650514.1 acyltransferase [Pseudomonadota bacterium]